MLLFLYCFLLGRYCGILLGNQGTVPYPTSLTRIITISPFEVSSVGLLVDIVAATMLHMLLQSSVV